MPRSRLFVARLVAALTGLASLVCLAPGVAQAADPFVVLVDDGSIENHAFETVADETAIQNKVLAMYAAAGQELPEILSVWTTFSLGGNPYGTYFDPIGADVTGIGLGEYYPPDGIMTSSKPPLRSILFHNDVTKLAQRSALQKAPEEGFARYLFLLELSHNWGPALDVPAPNPTSLVGFPFHWSFFMDAGGSLAGGNVWTDNGDGSFTTVAASPATLKYSMLDLYIMGLATTDEVSAFGVLESVMAPATPTDPLWGGAYAGHSFPWFDTSSTLTVQATRRTLTIDDVITANGARDPAPGTGPTHHTLGIVLIVGGTESPDTVASERATFSSIAASLAPAFHDATHQRGTLDVVTHDDTGGAGGTGGTSGIGGTSGTGGTPAGAAGDGGAGGVAGTGGASASSAGATAGSSAGGASGASGSGGKTGATDAVMNDDNGCGCSLPGERGASSAAMALMALGVAGMRRRRALPSRRLV